MELKNLCMHKKISVPWQQLPRKPGKQTSNMQRQFLLPSPSPSASSSSPLPHLSPSSTIHLPPSPPLTNSPSPPPRNSRYMKSSSPQLLNPTNTLEFGEIVQKVNKGYLLILLIYLFIKEMGLGQTTPCQTNN